MTERWGGCGRPYVALRLSRSHASRYASASEFWRCEPYDVSAENRGYDIESRDRKTDALRFIEVKGRQADARAVTITRNEMLAALNAAHSFDLAVVLVKGDLVFEPLYARNPSPVSARHPSSMRTTEQLQWIPSGNMPESNHEREPFNAE